MQDIYISIKSYTIPIRKNVIFEINIIVKTLLLRGYIYKNNYMASLLIHYE
jgi:hypothetical protein